MQVNNSKLVELLRSQLADLNGQMITLRRRQDGVKRCIRVVSAQSDLAPVLPFTKKSRDLPFMAPRAQVLQFPARP